MKKPTKIILILIFVVSIIGSYIEFKYLKKYWTKRPVVLDTIPINNNVNNNSELFKKGDSDINNLIITQVKYVYDGDTFMIANNKIVRLFSIDTPEKGEKCYQEAKDRLIELVLKKGIVLEQGSVLKDKYDRMLAWVFLNNQNINLLLVKEGLAKAFILSDEAYNQDIIQAENWAKAKKIGCLWKN